MGIEKATTLGSLLALRPLHLMDQLSDFVQSTVGSLGFKMDLGL